MRRIGSKVNLALLMLALAFLTAACEETASRFTDRTIENLEEEVGGAAERSRQQAADKAGGGICGSTLAAPLGIVAFPALISLLSHKTSHGRREHKERTKLNGLKQLIDNNSKREDDHG